MSEELRILILEDVPTDAELMEEELRESGMTFVSKRVAARTAFINAINGFSPHIILSDYSLPSFDGQAALKISVEKCPDTPFIFVSGALGEEMAIELLKKGATDYVLKNKLSRLGPAVSRALNEAEERKERKRVEDALKESEVRYRTIFENTGTATIIIDEDATIILANRQFERLSGLSRSEVEGEKSWLEFVVKDDLAKVNDLKRPWGKHFKMPSDGYEFRITGRQGNIRSVLANIALIPSTKRTVMSLLDITERKTAEEALKTREQELELKSQSLQEANTALKVLLKHREEDKTTLEEQVLANVKKLVLPYLEKLKNLKLDKNQLVHVEIVEAHLNDIISPFLRNLTSAYLNLTPREIEVASLVKEGKTTKEITELLNISPTAVDFHRKNLRSKFGIKSKKTNLRSYLTSISS
ncbi:MAG TPA: PAS domain S-box protein [Syntrophales bacterium]|nr:PAS domain S-box protein [Syntrophales bacterium]